MHELRTARESDDVEIRSTETHFITNDIEEPLDGGQRPLRFRTRVPRSVDHVAEHVRVARVVPSENCGASTIASSDCTCADARSQAWRAVCDSLPCMTNTMRVVSVTAAGRQNQTVIG